MNKKRFDKYLNRCIIATAIVLAGLTAKLTHKMSTPGYKTKNSIQGKVIEEKYTKDSKYIIKVKTDCGRILALNILDDGATTKETLDLLIDKDTRISMSKYPKYPLSERAVSFAEPDVRVGYKYASEIEVLYQKRL